MHFCSTDKFIPEFPYKLNTNASGIHFPLSERDNYVGAESGEHGPISVQTSDTPSTPTSIPRKRGREQTYFDSPSGSFVFSEFDKDGLPRRPRKIRKLRLDPLFSPDNEKPGSEMVQLPILDWFEDHQDSQLGKGHGQHVNACLLSASHMTTIRMPDTPDKPVTCKQPTVPHQYFPACEHLQDPTHLSPPATSANTREKIAIAPIRTVNFTNPPPPTRWRFLEAGKTTKARGTGTLSSIARPTENEVKTPKKISFADHAQVCVYPVSPQPPDCTSLGSAQQLLEPNDETRVSGKKVKSYAEPTAMTKDPVPQPCSLPEMEDENFTGHLGGDQPENDTLKLTMEDVRAIRCHLLESATANGVDDGQLATMFELGKTFRGMAFRHVW